MIECEIGTLPSNCCMPASKMPCPCNTCSKVAQIAAIRQRVSDILAGAIYANRIDEALYQAIQDVFGVSIRMEDRPTVMADESIPDSLAAWLWEMGVRG